MILHSTALMALIYYRASCFFNDAKSYSTSTVAILAWFLVFASELLLSFIWTLGQAFRWRPTTRTVFPESLPEDTELPAIDVLICTTDPEKEPTLEVMNTVLSAMALDYPAEKLNVYLSDDGGSSLTLYAMREAGAFASSWVPFCKDYNVKTRYPEGYFTAPKEDDSDIRGIEFREARQKVQVGFSLSLCPSEGQFFILNLSVHLSVLLDGGKYGSLLSPEKLSCTVMYNCKASYYIFEINH